MSVTFRYEKDHLQSIADQLSDSIACFFSGASPDTVLNLTNGCRDKTHNLGTYFKKRGDIERIRFWSSSTLANGKTSYTVSYAKPTSNWTKHADTGTDTTQKIAKHTIAPQLLGAIVDFQQLKERLLECGAAKVTDSKHFYTRQGLKSLKDALALLDIVSALQSEFSRVTYNRPPKVDVASGLFLDWYAATTIRENTPIRKLLNNPPCELPIGQMGRLAKADINILKGVNRALALIEKYTDPDNLTPEYLREEQLRASSIHGISSLFSMRNILKRHNCHLGSRARREYYLDVVRDEDGNEISGAIPYTPGDAVYVIDDPEHPFIK